MHEMEITFREILAADIVSVATLLSRGFPNHELDFWLRALGHLSTHQQPPGFPKYGYVMEQHGVAVGVVLTIFSAVRVGDTFAVRCNPCAWYVDPPFRAYAGLLFARALAHKNVTYLNVSPAPHTEQTIEALGFERYCNGMFIAIPLLRMTSGEGGVKVLGALRRPSVDFDPFEQELLAHHAEHDCMSLWCEASERAYAFVFHRRLAKGFIPCAQLIYCRAIEDFVRFGAPIGRFLALRGILFVTVGANGPIPGIVGRFCSGVLPRYFKGPQRPSLADIAYTEFGILGI